EKYETVIVHDGQAAVQAFEAHHPDLLLLDVMMPVIDGFSVCREIRKISQVPIIMITAQPALLLSLHPAMRLRQTSLLR
ncbi:MAG TPA: response regulator, partial [Clostridiaceae bacterium]|nr:response regulator [Clostridiaceae bacterium]